MHNLPATGLIRLKQIIGDSKANPPIPAVINISKSQLWHLVKCGKFPQPRKLSARTTVWSAEEIHHYIENGGGDV